jgi:hypothetical protein
VPDAKNIAVIAVHGVGHHEPFASARAIADLLLRTPRDRSPDYTSFTETEIQIATRAVDDTPDATDATPASPLLAVSERSAHPRIQDDPFGPDHLLMSHQLNGYRPAQQDGLYETIRIEGRHLGPAATAADSRGSQHAGGSNVDAQIHVYEMYWSDISRIGSSIFGIFGAFYQLVIHLPYIGRSTIEFARPRDASRNGSWALLATAYTWAMRALTLAAPVLNMVMAALATSLLVRHLPVSAEPLVARSVLVVVAVVATLVSMYRIQVRWGWLGLALPLVAGGLVALLATKIPIASSRALLVFEWWALMSLPLFGVLSVFQKNRPGALLSGAVIYLITTILLAWHATAAAAGVTRLVLPVLEWQYLALDLSWAVFGLSFLVVVVAGVWLSRGGRPRDAATEDQTVATRQAIFTGRFALALPAIAFSVMTLLVWGLLITAESKATFENEPAYAPEFRYPSLLAHLSDTVADSTKTCAFVRGGTGSDSTLHCAPGYFIQTFAGVIDTPYGLVSAALIAVGGIVLLLMLGPILLTELQSPPTPPEKSERDGFDRRSRRLGVWLDSSFRSGRVVGETLGVACIIAFLGLLTVMPGPLSNVLGGISGFRIAGLHPFGIGFLTYGNLIIGSGASTLGVLAVFHWLSGAGAGIRPALGIAADVDNYLRELPRDRTPRARMAERYASLLRYVCDWRADSSDARSGYDAVIVVAHSQGTVITADLLRYLKTEKTRRRTGAAFEPRLDRLVDGAENHLPITFFTMGSPLRQLYARRFPHLYGWVGGAGPNLDAVGADLSSLLGVRRWINVFRSADYVGRTVWAPDAQNASAYDPFQPLHDAPTSRDTCIGPGAHTHYWDETADYVAERLDALICESVGLAKASAR